MFDNLSPEVRRLAGIYPNLPHTNDVEAINNLLGLESGKYSLNEAVLDGRLDTVLQTRLEDITRSFVGFGDYEMSDEQYIIRPGERLSGKIIRKKLEGFFGSDPDPLKKLSIWKCVRHENPLNTVDSEVGKGAFEKERSCCFPQTSVCKSSLLPPSS